MASLSQGRTAAAQCGLFTHKSVPVIFEPPCINDFKEICWEDVEWIHLAQNSKKWRAVVYTVMNPWVT